LSSDMGIAVRDTPDGGPCSGGSSTEVECATGEMQFHHRLKALHLEKQRLRLQRQRFHQERQVLVARFNQLRTEYTALLAGSNPRLPVPTGTLKERERRHILSVLKQTNWVIGGKCGAAALLGLKRTTLLGKLRKLGV